MTYFGAKQFAQLTDDLTILFTATLTEYAASHGLTRLPNASMDQMSVSMRDVAAESLMFGCDTWPESAQPIGEVPSPFETTASETDPPRAKAWFWTLLTLLFTGPAAAALSIEAVAPLGSFFYTIGVIMVSAVLGTRYALVLAAVSLFLHNLFDIPPRFELTWPEASEFALAAFYVMVAFGIPRLNLISAWIRSSLFSDLAGPPNSGAAH